MMKIKRNFFGVLVLGASLLGISTVYAKMQPVLNQKTVTIQVPLENQNEEKKLGNGCEITALSMLLNYYGYQTTKNKLAEKLTYVPVWVNDTLHGDPQDGFVGNINGGLEAMGVGVEPVAQVAQQVVQSDVAVHASRNLDFAEIESLVKQGTPVWVETTTDFRLPAKGEIKTWQTQHGTINVVTLCHAVVITGISQDWVYVNDPYGHKDRQVEKARFIKTYQIMGSQSLYLA